MTTAPGFGARTLKEGARRHDSDSGRGRTAGAVLAERVLRPDWRRG